MEGENGAETAEDDEGCGKVKGVDQFGWGDADSDWGFFIEI